MKNRVAWAVPRDPRTLDFYTECRDHTTVRVAATRDAQQVVQTGLDALKGPRWSTHSPFSGLADLIPGEVQNVEASRELRSVGAIEHGVVQVSKQVAQGCARCSVSPELGSSCGCSVRFLARETVSNAIPTAPKPLEHHPPRS